MDIPANRPRLSRKKFWCRFMKCTVRYESHLVTMSAKCFQNSLAKCPGFSCHFLPSMLCVPAPCVVELCFLYLDICPRMGQYADEGLQWGSREVQGGTCGRGDGGGAQDI